MLGEPDELRNVRGGEMIFGIPLMHSAQENLPVFWECRRRPLMLKRRVRLHGK